jgi:hypothetical protein
LISLGLEAVSIDKQSYNGIVHNLQLREANRLAHKPLDPSAKEKILVLYFLGISFAGGGFN